MIERVMRDIKQLVKIQLVDLKLDMSNWTRLVPSIMFALNQRASAVLAGNAPITVHTGMKPKGLLSLVMGQEGAIETIEWKGKMIPYLNSLSAQLDVLHESVRKATEEKNKNACKEEEAIPEFEIGDYVLYCYMDRKEITAKHDFQWRGPYQVVDVKHKYVYTIRDLVSSRRIEAHATRMSFYSTKQMGVNGALTNLISKQGLKYEVERIAGIIWDEDKRVYRVKVLWRGFDEEEASYEPLRSIFEQIPLAVIAYLEEWRQMDAIACSSFMSREGAYLRKTIKAKGLKIAKGSLIDSQN